FGRWNFGPDRLIDQVAQARGFFNASAGSRPEVEPHLSAVGCREKILPEPRQQQEPGHAKQKKCGDENPAAVDEGRQPQLVLQAYSLKSPLEGALEKSERIPGRPEDMLLCAQKIHRQSWNQGARKDI